VVLARLFSRRPLRRTAAGVAAVVLATSVSAVAFAPAALAVPGITLGKSGPTSVLADGTAAFTLTAGNPASNPTAAPEYNLSFRDVLPLGLTYVAGSTSPTSAGEPQIVTDPGTGQQTLIWRNVGDLQISDTFALGFRADTDPAVLPVGSTFTNTGSAYANTDPRRIPAFSATGAPVAGSFTETATASTPAIQVSALTVSKTEPSPESELLRGVHDNPTVYTVRVENTAVSATGSVVLVDHIPAALEFLGCGGVDNSAAREYPGAPSLAATPAVPGCVLPDSVTTVTNPPAQGSTTYPPGVYTRVQWTIGTMAPGAVVTRPYAAGIPLRRNTATFPGGTPTGASLGQVANLDNNTGSSTRETGTEASATNIVRASGTYTGPVVGGGSTATAADDRRTVTIEDVRMRKAVSGGQFSSGGTKTYTITIDSSEYVSGSDIVVSDLVPDGMCPKVTPGVNYIPGGPSYCTGTVVGAPSVSVDGGPAVEVGATAVLQGDGSSVVTFSALPVALPADSTAVLTYEVGMLETYVGGANAGEPTSSGDSFTNTATVTATTDPIPGTGETGPQAVTDGSSATVGTGELSLDKSIRPRSAAGVCGTDGAGYGEPSDFAPDETRFRKGDLVCFKLRVDFDDTTRTRNPVVTDFLPVGTEYVTGSATGTTANSTPVSVAETADSLVFTIGTQIGSARFADLGAVFEYVFAVRVTDAAPVGQPDVLGNAMKLRVEDSSGRGRSFRDLLDFTVVPAAPVEILKGVESVDTPAAGPNGPDVDGLQVREGSVAGFRIDITNTATPGAVDAYATGSYDVWDVLPEGITCAAVSNIEGQQGLNAAIVPTITCTDPGDPGHPTFADRDDRSAIRWVYAAVSGVPAAEQATEPGETWTFRYDVTIPSPTTAGAVLTNTAAVRSFSALSNVPVGQPGAVVQYYPQDNIDTTIPVADQDAAPAEDDSNVFLPRVTVAKTGTTAITETNNNAPNQATMGEGITYRYALVIPAGTSLVEGVLADTLPLGVQLVPGAPNTLEFCPQSPATSGSTIPACAAPAGAPAGVTFDATTGEVQFGALYDNSTAFDQRFLVTVSARVTSNAITTAQNAINRTNVARYTGLERAGGSALAPVTASYVVNIRQPLPDVTKTNDAGGVVLGGQTVTFTIDATNRNANATGTTTNRPPLHDAFLVDCLPAGLTFASYGANPGLAPVPGDGSNGCATGTTRMVWSLGTVEPTPGTSSVQRTYTATVDLTAAGGQSYTNTVRLTGSTLNDAKPTFDAPDNPLERTYATTDSSTLTVAGAGTTKGVDEPIRTVGQVARFTVTAIIPPDVNFYEASVLDTIPAGMGAPQNVGLTCRLLPSNLLCPSPVNLLTPAPAPGGGTTFGVTVGDISSSTSSRIYTLTYDSTVLDVAAATAGANLTNTAQTAWFLTDGNTVTSVTAPFDRRGIPDTATVTVVEPSLTIDKVVSDPTPGPGEEFRYTITVTNRTGATVSDAFNIVVEDQVPAGVVVGLISGAGQVTGADPVTGGGTVRWAPPELEGPLAPGESVVLSYRATLAPSATLDTSALVNTARIASYESLLSGGRVYPGSSDTATITPAFPEFTAAKQATSGAPAYIGDEYTWTVRVTNTGGAVGFGVDVTDDLPLNWTYVPGSAVVQVGGDPSAPVEPDVLDVGPAQLLVWTDLGSLLPGESLTIVYRAVPGPGVVTLPGVGSTVPHVNGAVAFGEDATGSDRNLLGVYGGDPVDAQTRIDSADVRIVKSHAAPPVAGSTFDWTVTVTNDGADTAVGPFTVTDQVEAPATFVSATGTGWTCTEAAGEVTCARTNAAATLASGASFPPITVRVSLPAGLAEGTELSNTAEVTARTYDPDPANNVDTDTADVITRADLALTKNRTGAIVAGQDATYTLDVVNNGPSVSRGPITVVDDLPTGTTFVSASGSGWVCTPAVGSVSCERADDLAPGQAAPQITVVISVPSSQTAVVENTATVTGTTTDPVPGNNTDTDSGTPTVLADLAIQKANVGAVVAGGQATYRLTVDNAGPSDAAAPVRITDTLPTGLTYVSSADVVGSWTCSAAAQTVTCDLAGPLAADPGNAVDGDAIVEITVDVASSVAGRIDNIATVSSPTTDPNLGNNTDTESTDFVGEADLEIVKSHSGDATAGEQLVWTLQVTNNGPSDSSGPIVVTDSLPAGVSYVSASGADWSCTENGGDVECTRTATLVAGDDAPPILLTVLVDPSAGPATIRNAASVDGPVTDPVPGNNTDTDDVTVLDEAELVLTKDAATPVVLAGTTAEFTVEVTNLGPSAADSVTVLDLLPSGLTPVSADGPGWTCTITGQQVACDRPALQPAASRTITITADVGQTVLDGSVLTNTATVSTTTPGDDPDNNTDTADVTVDAEADLALTKVTDPASTTVIAGERATWTIAVSNAGPSAAQAPITVTDTLPAGFSFVVNGGPWTCTPAGQDLTCVLDGGAPLAAGADAPDLTVTALVEPTTLPGDYVNTAEVDSPTVDPDPSNNGDTATVEVVVDADLAITKSHTGPVRVGDDLVFTLEVVNDGPSVARDVVVTDTLPAGLSYAGASSAAGTWTCAEAGGTVTCELAGVLAPGATAEPIELTVTVDASAYPTVTNTADVDSSTPDRDPSNNSSSDPVVVPALVDLTIAKSHTGDVAVGSTATWDLEVTNLGPTADPGPVTVVDTLPTGLTFVSGAGDGWTCSAAAQDVTCTRAAGLDLGASSTIALTTQVEAAAFPSVVNVASVSTPSEETDLTNNTAQDTAEVIPLVELGILKEARTVDLTFREVVWRITVTNNGPNASQVPIVVTDVLPAGLTYVSASGRGWVCTATGRTVVCEYAASLAAGQSASFDLVTSFSAALTGTVDNTAVVEGTDPNPDNNTSTGSFVIPPDTGGGGGGDLPQTGADLVALGLLGLVLLALGVAVVGTTRRRPPATG
jgi:uncharacterized repeat protein (TIGR01451 family)/LPXTG-motif cell wall-anchored protein